MDREVALLAEMDKVKAEASKYFSMWPRTLIHFWCGEFVWNDDFLDQWDLDKVTAYCRVTFQMVSVYSYLRKVMLTVTVMTH